MIPASWPVLAAALLLIATPSLAARPAPHPAAPADAGTPVVLRQQPGTALDAAARQLVAKDVGDVRAGGDRPLVLVGTASLSAKPGDRPALFVQVQSARQCGSAGCSTLVYLWRNGIYERVLDGADGKLTVSAHRTGGMADILSDGERYVWDGSAYRDANPGPAIDLRPRRRR